MTVTQIPWENGSFFHLLSDREGGGDRSPWDGKGVLYGSGRDALRSLIRLGQMERGWNRLWVPSYFCQTVVKSFLSTGIQVLLYPDGPQNKAPVFDGLNMRQGDAILRMNYFGLRRSLQMDGLDRSLVEVIDDHSHDPWSVLSRQSDADWCVASLRKTLPIPDGGVLWSPAEHGVPLPPSVTREHNYACLNKFAAMALKTLYLSGYPVDKTLFRELAESGEEGIASNKISGMPKWVEYLLKGFPISLWREKRKTNHRMLSLGLKDIPFLEVLQPADDTGTCPFAGIILFDLPEQRDHVRQCLVVRDIYPTILWPMDDPAVDGIPSEHIEFSRRMFSIHCDMRYSEADMDRIIHFVHEACLSYQHGKDVGINA